MPVPNLSLLATDPLSNAQLMSIFRMADRLHACGFHSGKAKTENGKVIACLFLEPSTRTRLSFQMAAFRLGYQALVFDNASGSSLVKGESLTDTVLNIVAMRPDLLVIRYGESAELDTLLPRLSLPVINGGSGITAHPTQALLDAYTILNLRGKLEGERVLIVGDIKHSRVAHSNFDVLKKLGAEIAVCGPPEYLPSTASLQTKNVRIFEDLDQGIEWASVYMGLRVQLERHGKSSGPSADFKDANSGELAARDKQYQQQFGLTPKRLRNLAKDASILHPGPVNHGVEFSYEVATDPRYVAMKQVENGVLIRAVLMAQLLKTHSLATGPTNDE